MEHVIFTDADITAREFRAQYESGRTNDFQQMNI